jgi:hypothetical protein
MIGAPSRHEGAKAQLEGVMSTSTQVKSLGHRWCSKHLCHEEGKRLQFSVVYEAVELLHPAQCAPNFIQTIFVIMNACPSSRFLPIRSLS